MWISFRKLQELQAPEPIRIRNNEIERVKIFKLLGVHIQSDLKWIAHIEREQASDFTFFVFAVKQTFLPKLD